MCQSHTLLISSSRWISCLDALSMSLFSVSLSLSLRMWLNYALPLHVQGEALKLTTIHSSCVSITTRTESYACWQDKTGWSLRINLTPFSQNSTVEPHKTYYDLSFGYVDKYKMIPYHEDVSYIKFYNCENYIQQVCFYKTYD